MSIVVELWGNSQVQSNKKKKEKKFRFLPKVKESVNISLFMSKFNSKLCGLESFKTRNHILSIMWLTKNELDIQDVF